MITAHLPAAYLTGRCFAASGTVLWCATIGGVLPDLDLIWFYLIDNRAFHHHHYWVHIPAFWAAVALVGVPLTRIFCPDGMPGVLAFFSAIFVHLVLDSLAGDIKWLWPLSDRFFHLIEVPARYANWILNFVLHPLFLLEILIWGAASQVFTSTYRKRKGAE